MLERKGIAAVGEIDEIYAGGVIRLSDYIEIICYTLHNLAALIDRYN